MDIILIMCIGILVGRFLVPQGMKKFNERVSMCCTWLLIFAMGVMLGEREGFLEDLSMLGVRSFFFFLIPTVCSIILVYILSKRFIEKKQTVKAEKELEE